MRWVVGLAVLSILACSRAPSEGIETRRGALTAPEPTSGPPCAESARRCTFTFTYADHGESSVEVRGDFAEGAWKSGAPLTKRGTTWSADVDVPYGKDVQYKLFLDGDRWLKDPARAAFPGTDNTKLDALTCNPHRCVAP